MLALSIPPQLDFMYNSVITLGCVSPLSLVPYYSGFPKMPGFTTVFNIERSTRGYGK